MKTKSDYLKEFDESWEPRTIFGAEIKEELGELFSKVIDEIVDSVPEIDTKFTDPADVINKAVDEIQQWKERMKK